MNDSQTLVAKVALPLGLDREFDYSLKDKSDLKPGMRVLVNFSGRKMLGVITDFKAPNQDYQLKPIITSLDPNPILNEKQLAFALALKNIYPYPLSGFLFMMLPPYLRKPRAINEQFNYVETTNPTAAEPIFIKENYFAKRYELWKDKVKEALTSGSVMICFPQLTYIQEAIKIIKDDFPQELNIIHSQINPKKLLDLWLKTRKNSLIIGTRSSLFYFPQDLKLIILEEETNHCYFQEEKPFYHLADVAYVLAGITNSQLILSGDYPRISSYEKITKKEVKLIDSNLKFTPIRVVELIPIKGKKRVLNPLLVELIRKNSQEGKKIVIIWNKKGLGYCLKCSSCSYTLICSRCSKFLQLLSKENKGLCPYCGQKQDIPAMCPKCKQGYIKSLGLGIEKMQRLLKQMFPELIIDQWEKRSANTQVVLATNKILSNLYSQERFDIGFILDSDSFLARLDYEAALETFFYIKKIGLLVKDLLYVFTNSKDNYLYNFLTTNWQDIYNYELKLRMDLKLPPFGQIINITLRTKDEKRLLLKAQDLYNIFQEAGLEVYGPFKDHPFRLRGNYRYLLVIKLAKGIDFTKLIIKEVGKVKRSNIQVAIVVR